MLSFFQRQNRKKILFNKIVYGVLISSVADRYLLINHLTNVSFTVPLMFKRPQLNRLSLVKKTKLSYCTSIYQSLVCLFVLFFHKL